MRANIANLFWGIILILAGGVFLAMNLGYISPFSPQMWLIIFLGLSALFFITYFLKGIKEWGWLFPACILGGIGITMYLALNGYAEPLVGAPVLAGVGLPFLAAYLIDRKNWWALIPAWVMAVLLVILFISERGMDELVGALVMFAIALPFLIVFLVNREQKWALIPALVLGAIGLIVLLTSFIEGAWMATVVLWVIALPFLVVYFLKKDNWWALIPAGVLFSIGLALLAIEVLPISMNETALMNGVMYLGWAVTFGILWLRRSVQPTGWAVYPAIALAAASLLAFLLGTNTQFLWPAVLILGGVLVLIFSLRGRRQEG